jgi:2-keto-3-deoxy-galactonokinase
MSNKMRKAKQIFVNFHTGQFHQNLLTHSNLLKDRTKMDTFHGDVSAFPSAGATGWGIRRLPC